MANSPLASTSRHPLCTICSLHPSKYTCPRCQSRTCSLPCTKLHKSHDGCSGERDRTEYVGMDRYGDIGMWRDLGYLREVREKVSDWGKTTSATKSTSVANGNNGINERRRGAGTNMNANGKGKGREREPTNANATVPARVLNLSDKELRLKRQLATKGIEILFLPSGMEKHVQNLSNYNQKKKKLHLTVSISLYDSTTRQKIRTITTHYNELSTSLHALLKSATETVKSDLQLDLNSLQQYTLLLSAPIRPTTYIPRNAEPIIPAKRNAEHDVPKGKDKPLAVPHSSLPIKPTWVPELLEEEAVTIEEKEEVKPAVVTPKPTPVQPPRRIWQIGLSLTTTLEDALRGTSILEWPDLELWDSEVVKRDIEGGRLELVERRGVFERGKGWGNKRRAEEEQTLDAEPEQQDRGDEKRRLVEEVAVLEDDSSDSDSDNDSSDSSYSSSSDDVQ